MSRDRALSPRSRPEVGHDGRTNDHQQRPHENRRRAHRRIREHALNPRHAHHRRKQAWPKAQEYPAQQGGREDRDVHAIRPDRAHQRPHNSTAASATIAATIYAGSPEILRDSDAISKVSDPQQKAFLKAVTKGEIIAIPPIL